jgi:hypothetical protein
LVAVQEFILDGLRHVANSGLTLLFRYSETKDTIIRLVMVGEHLLAYINELHFE